LCNGDCAAYGAKRIVHEREEFTAKPSGVKNEQENESIERGEAHLSKARITQS
jgi:hypothetical protein